jgi:hypothetical protein
MEDHLTLSTEGIPYRPFLLTVAWQMLSAVHAHSIACNHGQCGELVPACTCREITAVIKSERHLSHRHGSSVPPMFCTIHPSSATTHVHQAKSLNMSSRGVYFVTGHPVCVWLPVQVLLRVPSRMARTLPSERIFTGRVRDVEWKDIPSGMPGIGVEFFYWQAPSENGPLSQMQP